MGNFQNTKTTRFFSLFIAFILMLPTTFPLMADEEEGWPHVIKAPEVTITMYQPQLERFEGNHLFGRSAVSVLPKGATEPVFGTIWARARVETDREAGTVEIIDVKIKKVRFPESKPEHEKKLAGILEKEMGKWEMVMTLDQLIAGLEMTEQRKAAAAGLKHDPPKIIVKNSPALLLMLDGDPILEDIEGSTLKQVVNCPYRMVQDPKSKIYYLNGGKTWMSASDVMGPWKPAAKVPKDVQKLTPSDEEIGETGTDERVPEIIVAKEATELIVIDGEPKFKTVQEGELLYVENSESDILMEVVTQRYFVLLSGRWFAGKSLNDGPWAHVPADELPGSFAKIPPASDMETVLAHVPGTEQAKEAVLDAQVPQTSSIKRDDKSLKVAYDGNPKFEKVEDSTVQYAVNTSSSVFKVNKMYYCCHEAAWYEAKGPTGPWTVCVKVPDEIYSIPPSCPHHNVTYVYVYDYTPSVVYVGYYPGYMGAYVYGGTVIYGSGWWYRPWYGRYYYPRVRTWGFHVRYTPWGGWGVGFSYGMSRFTFTVGLGGRYGWWGPARYRPYYRGGYRAGYRAGYLQGQRQAYHRASRNIYKSQRNTARNVQRTQIQQRKRAATAPAKKNNVYSDSNGNVYRQQQSGNWEKRSNGNWSNTKVNRNSNMSRESQSRKRGSSSRSHSGRPAGGARGGKRR